MYNIHVIILGLCTNVLVLSSAPLNNFPVTTNLWDHFFLFARRLILLSLYAQTVVSATLHTHIASRVSNLLT